MINIMHKFIRIASVMYFSLMYAHASFTKYDPVGSKHNIAHGINIPGSCKFTSNTVRSDSGDPCRKLMTIDRSS